MRVPRKQLVEAIRDSGGRIYSAAAGLGVAPSTIYRRLEKDEGLREIVQAERELFCDYAESALRKKIEEGDTASIIFALKCLGRQRGWVERPDNVAIAISTLMDPAAAAAMVER